MSKKGSKIGTVPAIKMSEAVKHKGWNLRVFAGVILYTLTIIIAFTPASADPGWEKVPADPTVVKMSDSFGSFTGTRISNDGHILTVRHGFNACLIGGGFTESSKILPSFASPYSRDPLLYRINWESKPTCKIKIDGELKAVQILAASDQFMIPSDQGTLTDSDEEVYKRLIAEHTFHNGDYAIVKEVVSKITYCRKASSRELEIGESVFYKGYPSATTGRPEGKDSDGKSLLASFGTRVSSILENQCLPKNGNKDHLQLKYQRPELILSTVDVVPKASGSALLNFHEEIVGVINSTFSQGVVVNQTYCAGSALALSTSFIFDHMAKRLNRSEIQEIWSCNPSPDETLQTYHLTQ